MTSAIKLHYWNGRRNFGDELSVAAVEWVTGVPVVHAESDAVGKLLAIGSVLEKAGKGDIVWGSGLHPGQYDEFWMNKAVGRLIKKRRYAQLEFKVLAVRGPMARDALLFRGVDCPEIYGDPGILVNQIYPAERNPIRKVGYIPHFNDKQFFKDVGHIIDVESGWQNVVDEILSCETVVSSSLHGIIVAEAYGVPAVWLRTIPGEGGHKFFDYYLGTGRAARPVYSFKDAAGVRFDSPPDFSDLSKSLICALKEVDLNSVMREV
jgi:pyruvyltransferase